MIKLSGLFNSIQAFLLPGLEEELNELSSREQEFVRAVELIKPDEYIREFTWKGVGAKPHSRTSILKAFIAKPIFQHKSVRMLIDNIKSSPNLRRLCGWERHNEIPSESTFSRAFSAFAKSNLTDKIHESMIKENYQLKIVGHISRDSTSIVGREKACRKNSHGNKRVHKCSTTKPKRIDVQIVSPLEKNLSSLPQKCDYGIKKDSNGKMYIWRGYKLNLDCGDGGVPISAIVTSASMHDSQAAIPLMQMSKERVTSLYDIMDSAYDSAKIRNYSLGLNHRPIIEDNYRRRGRDKIEFDPATAIRYNERTTIERANSELKDNYGLENIYVKGYAKVKCHVMLAVIALTAKALFNMLI